MRKHPEHHPDLAARGSGVTQGRPRWCGAAPGPKVGDMTQTTPPEAPPGSRARPPGDPGPQPGPQQGPRATSSTTSATWPRLRRTTGAEQEDRRCRRRAGPPPRHRPARSCGSRSSCWCSSAAPASSCTAPAGCSCRRTATSGRRSTSTSAPAPSRWSIAGVIAALALIGDTMGGYGFPWPLAVVALVVLLVGRRSATGTGRPAGPTATPDSPPRTPARTCRRPSRAG